MSVKYQVFVSSTYDDLVKEREYAIKTILKMGHIPVGMEMFNAADDEQWKVIKRRIDECDYYVVIVAHRYGSQVEDGTSYTEMEYDYAISKGVPVLGFIIDATVKWDPKSIDDGEKKKSLDNFKEKLKQKTVEFWNNKDGLQGQIAMALTASIDQIPREGWVRPSEVTNPEMGKEISRLSGENAQLRTALEKAEASFIESYEEEINKTEKALNANHRILWYRDKIEKDWVKTTDKVSLMDIFIHISHELLDEMSEERVSQMLSFIAPLPEGGEVDKKASWTVPSNHVKAYLGDLSVLDLVEPSKKRHPVKDKSIYWTLTEGGKKFNKIVRRRRLEKGIEDKIPEDEKLEGGEEKS